MAAKVLILQCIQHLGAYATIWKRKMFKFNCIIYFNLYEINPLRELIQDEGRQKEHEEPPDLRKENSSDDRLYIVIYQFANHTHHHVSILDAC